MEVSEAPSKKPRLETASPPTLNGVHNQPEPEQQTVPTDLEDEPCGPPSSSPAPGTSQTDTSKDDDDDNVSVISGLSDMSGKEWKPNMTGKLGWLMRARNRGADPRELVSSLFQDVGMLNELDDSTIWAILFKMFAEPPRREKLKNFNTLEDIAQHIKHAKNILVLTGAGVSVSCGIPDFRSKDGVYARLAVDFPDLPDPQAMFDIHYFRKDPRPFFKFAKEIYPGQFSPSPCHKFINCLEKSGKLLRNYTQNIDTLEQVAGISQVVQCHGSFATASCTICRSKLTAEYVRDDIMNQRIPLCPTCPSPDLQAILDGLSKVQKPSNIDSNRDPTSADPSQGETKDPSESLDNPSSSAEDNPTSSAEGGAPSDVKLTVLEKLSSVQPPSPFSTVPIMKPDIVFFGEGLSDEFHRKISEDKEKVDLLIVIGSSLKVRPVALIPSSIPEHIPQILINRERLSHLTFDVELLGDCDTVINQLCHMLEGDWSSPIHRPPLVQTQSLPDLNGSLDESKEELDTSELGATDDDKPEETETRLPTDQTKLEQTEKETDEATTETKPVTNDAVEANTNVSEENCTKVDSGEQPGPSSESNDKNDESDDWRPKPISELIPDGHFLHIPPHRYVFSGAEVYADDLSDNEMEDDDDSDEEDDPPTSSDQVQEEPGEEEQADNEADEQVQTFESAAGDGEVVADENLNKPDLK